MTPRRPDCGLHGKQFRRVRDRFRLEVAEIFVVLSGPAKLYAPFPLLWMFFQQCPVIALPSWGLF
jgi:hypothetical protein